MSRLDRFGRRLAAGALVLGSALAAASGAAAAPLRLPDHPYRYTVIDQDLAAALQEFGANLAINFAGATVQNTILAQPLGGGANCSGTVTSAGFNLTDETGCGLTQPTDQTETDPLLSPLGLADNGGPTKTIALQEGSPAIDKGLSSAGETVDQRGLTRPVEIPGVPNAAGGDGTDIGAFEVQLPPGPGPGASTGPIPSAPTPEPTPTVTIKGLAATTHKRDLKIRFTSSVPGSSFRCKLDGKPYKTCRPPFKVKGLSAGRHRFSVIATSPAGISGKPAKKSFRVLAAR